MKCPNCGHENDTNATFCENCGKKLIGAGGMPNSTKALIVVVAVLVLGIGVVYGMYMMNNQIPANNSTVLNQTIQNGTNIPYSSDYITFDKAKSIAIQNAATGVSVSEPILMKNKEGQAIYVCYYYYKGYSIGGIIINAKTGDIIYKEQNLPSNYNQQTNTNNNYQNSQQNNGGNSVSNTVGDTICPYCDGTGVITVNDYTRGRTSDTYEITCYNCDGCGYI